MHNIGFEIMRLFSSYFSFCISAARTIILQYGEATVVGGSWQERENDRRDFWAMWLQRGEVGDEERVRRRLYVIVVDNLKGGNSRTYWMTVKRMRCWKLCTQKFHELSGDEEPFSVGGQGDRVCSRKKRQVGTGCLQKLSIGRKLCLRGCLSKAGCRGGGQVPPE